MSEPTEAPELVGSDRVPAVPAEPARRLDGIGLEDAWRFRRT